jgi:acetylglutamate kinase
MKHEHIRMSFIAKIAELQEETLQILVVHKQIMKWHEKQAKMQDQIEYIKEIQKAPHSH